MDLMLALSENSLHHVLWTDELLDEWERVIVREHQRSTESAASVTAAIRHAFADLRIDPDTYRSLIGEMPGPDPDDHPHSAAAIAADVDALVTWDRNGFPVDDLARLGVRVTDPDAYLSELFDELADDVMATIAELARSKRRPPMSAADVVDAIERAGLPSFAARARARLSD